MAVTNAETTGRTGTCTACGEAVEEGLLLKGMMVRAIVDEREVRVPSAGIPVWRRLGPWPGVSDVQRERQQAPRRLAP